MQEMQIQSLGREDPLEKEMATNSSTFAWEKSHGLRSLVGYSPCGRKESDRTKQLHFHFQILNDVGKGIHDWVQKMGHVETLLLLIPVPVCCRFPCIFVLTKFFFLMWTSYTKSSYSFVKMPFFFFFKSCLKCHLETQFPGLP